ncbi:MAG: hypothetical protein K8I30_13635 [Anaerolineae bacterium]|nr:hypothetical protein [Anaerolineae bacterium]
MTEKSNAAQKHASQPHNTATTPASPELETPMPQDDIRVQLGSGQLNPAAIRYLQRTIGNAEVLKLLARDKAQPAGQTVAPRRAETHPTIRLTEHKALPIQRKIGFEFQINGSRVQPVNGVKRLKKGAAIGSKLDGVEPTVDINQSNDYDLEFVSDAFDEDNEQGWKNFIKAVERTAVTTSALAGKGTKLASEVFDGGLNDHNVRVDNTIGVVHITQGIQLDKLHHYLTGFGNRTAKKKKTGDRPEKLADFTQDAINQANEAITSLERREGVGFSDVARGEYASLMGLLAGNMSRLGGSAGPYLKSYFKSMNRTDISTLMNQVKTRLLTEMGEQKPTALTSAFTAGDIKALIQVPLWQVLNLSQKIIPIRPFNEDAEVWTASGLGEITRLEWLNALWEGNDMLSAKWQAKEAAANKLKGAMAETPGAVEEFKGKAEQHEAAAEILESVGGYGGKTDVDHTGTSLRPIFEIRDMGNVPAAQLEKWVQIFAEYMKNLNEGTETRPFYEVWAELGG